jgi:hypothetical protein
MTNSSAPRETPFGSPVKSSANKCENKQLVSIEFVNDLTWMRPKEKLKICIELIIN